MTLPPNFTPLGQAAAGVVERLAKAMKENGRMITAPGIYLDFDVAAYHADPTPTPSLNQSIAKVLLAKSPLHAWHAHPRLNPDYRHDDATKYDVGNIVHKLMTGRGKEIVVLDTFDDWRTKAAQALRAEYTKDGRLVVLGKHFAKAQQMESAAREQLDLRGLGGLFDNDNGDGEVVLAWKEGDLWARQMVDWLTSERLTFVDFKTTGESAAPHALAWKMIADGWPIQAAMAERGLNVLDPQTAGRRQYLFVVQEDERPYALTVVELTEGTRTMGRKQLDMAFNIWSHCMEHDRWPGYDLDIVRPEYPGWAEAQWLEREIHDAARSRLPTEDILIAG